MISEANTARQNDRKRRLFLQNGSLEVWVFYPDTESVWLYRADSAQEFAGELRSELFPGVPIDLSKLFAAS